MPGVARLLLAGFAPLLLAMTCKEDAGDPATNRDSGESSGQAGDGGMGGAGRASETGVPMLPVDGSKPIGGGAPIGGEPPATGEGGQAGEGGGPTSLWPLSNVISLAQQCAVVEDGSVWCWGSNVNGLLGLADDTVSVPFAVRVPNIDDAVKVSTHGRHACVLLADATVKCWGHTLGGLGNPDAVANAGRISLPVPVLGLSDVVLLEAGPDVTCAVVEDGTLRCWGRPSTGVLELYSAGGSALPIPIPGIADAIGLTVGDAHACVWQGNAELICWGRNRGHAVLGQFLGAVYPPSAIPLPLPVVDALAAYGFTCALGHSELGDVKKMWCWGQSLNGRFGLPPLPPGNYAREPLEVPGLEGAVSLERMHDLGGCGLFQDGIAHCWGEDISDLPDANGVTSYEPVALAYWQGIAEISRLETGFCARLDGGVVECVGTNGAGSLGSGKTSSELPFSDVPVPVMAGVYIEP